METKMTSTLQKQLKEDLETLIADMIDGLPKVYRQFGLDGVVETERLIKKLEAITLSETPVLAIPSGVGSAEIKVMQAIHEREPLMPYMSPEVRELAFSGRKIDAIKAYRGQAEKYIGQLPSLKDAKDIIESIGHRFE